MPYATGVNANYNRQPVTTERTFVVTEVSWDEAAPVLRAIRFEVFVNEQAVPETLEWDGLDPQCRHVLARDAGAVPIGTGRLLPDGHGRAEILAPNGCG
jgi:predicted GNAT family N-acyltransferase